MNTNTITVTPNADFHLYISAGASVYLWIAGALLVALVIYGFATRKPPIPPAE